MDKGKKQKAGASPLILASCGARGMMPLKMPLLIKYLSEVDNTSCSPVMMISSDIYFKPLEVAYLWRELVMHD